jgi:hypothetical protein
MNHPTLLRVKYFGILSGYCRCNPLEQPVVFCGFIPSLLFACTQYREVPKRRKIGDSRYNPLLFPTQGMINL